MQAGLKKFWLHSDHGWSLCLQHQGSRNLLPHSCKREGYCSNGILGEALAFHQYPPGLIWPKVTHRLTLCLVYTKEVCLVFAVRQFSSNCSTLTIVILVFSWFFWFGLNKQLSSKSYLLLIVWKCDDNIREYYKYTNTKNYSEKWGQVKL